jgi:hypothetical protein
MVSLQSLLDRFRPAPPPGQPGPLGVPSERPRAVEAELAAVFLLIDAIEEECAAIKADGQRQAARLAQDAAVRASQIAETADRQAKDARALATRAVRSSAQERITATLDAARRDADEITRHGLAALPRRVERAVDRVRSIGLKQPDDVSGPP